MLMHVHNTGISFGVVLGLAVVFFILVNFQRGRNKSDYKSLNKEDEDEEDLIAWISSHRVHDIYVSTFFFSFAFHLICIFFSWLHLVFAIAVL